MISSIMSRDLASTSRRFEFGSTMIGRRKSPGMVFRVIWRPAVNTWPSRKKKCKLWAVLSHLALELKSIQSNGFKLSAVLKSTQPSSPNTLDTCGMCRMICWRSLRLFEARTVSAMVVSCMETGGSNMTCKKANWNPGSMYGTLLMYSSRMEMAVAPSLVGAEILYLLSFFGDSLGNLMQQITTSVSMSGSICNPLTSCKRKMPLSVL
mmetsp:Transcript_78428/g.196984  ORF Transcript_78428/g.196984 Transcript_78428/m.196984 type:complete len:208 (-) Transcript_78428:646-1269(-)